MRVLAAASVLVAIASTAAANGIEAGEPLSVEVGRFAAPIAPLRDLGTASVTVTTACAAVNGTSPPTVTFGLDDVPAFLAATVTPSAGSFEPCAGEFATARATLTVRATADAPAHRASRFNVTAAADGFQDATGAAVVIPGFYGVLDASVDTPIVIAAPGETVEIGVNVTNLGNGAQRVSVEIEEVTGGLSVAPPTAVVIGARQLGDRDIVERLVFRITAPEGGGYRNEPGQVTVRLAGTAVPTGDAGDRVAVSFLVTTRGFDASAPSALALAAALAVALLIVRHVEKGRRG